MVKTTAITGKKKNLSVESRRKEPSWLNARLGSHDPNLLHCAATASKSIWYFLQWHVRKSWTCITAVVPETVGTMWCFCFICYILHPLCFAVIVGARGNGTLCHDYIYLLKTSYGTATGFASCFRCLLLVIFLGEASFSRNSVNSLCFNVTLLLHWGCSSRSRCLSSNHSVNGTCSFYTHIFFTPSQVQTAL